MPIRLMGTFIIARISLHYGELAHLNLDDLEEASQHTNDEETARKEDQSTLPCGRAPSRAKFLAISLGRRSAGWHIECSVMSTLSG